MAEKLDTHTCCNCYGTFERFFQDYSKLVKEHTATVALCLSALTIFSFMLLFFSYKKLYDLGEGILEEKYDHIRNHATWGIALAAAVLCCTGSLGILYIIVMISSPA